MSRRPRIAMCGIRHETNTFSAVPTEYDDFRIHRGDELLTDAVTGAPGAEAVEFVPLFVASSVAVGRRYGGTRTAG